MIACVLLNISKNISGLKGLKLNFPYTFSVGVAVSFPCS